MALLIASDFALIGSQRAANPNFSQRISVFMPNKATLVGHKVPGPFSGSGRRMRMEAAHFGIPRAAGVRMPM
jgi:hypothetical protein